MKKWFAYLAVHLMGLPVAAQQKPHYTQYILNQYIVNPALTGIENYVDVKASHRLQWVGLLDAPVTTYLTVHGPIGKGDTKTTATSFQPSGINPRGSKYWEEYTVSSPHHGWGLQIINDRTGPLNNFSAMGTYAYHMGLSPRMNLAAGIGIGISNISLNADKLQFYNSSVDPAVFTNGLLNRTRLDINAGLYLYSSDFFVGISALQVAPSKIDFSNNVIKQIEGKSVPHFFATAGYRMLLGENFNLIPSVMLKYVQPVPMQVELNAKLQYQDLIWVGGGYRHKDGATALAGFNVGNLFQVGYSYDYITSRLNTFTRGTHEIMIGFTIGNKYGDTCPRNVW
ncbi:MAG TPA: hypothetical protein DCQ34_04475 [Chitinophagaceae bacterium]|nr:hypothetical protein [Chitinophagaceae bacterium]